MGASGVTPVRDETPQAVGANERFVAVVHKESIGSVLLQAFSSYLEGVPRPQLGLLNDGIDRFREHLADLVRLVSKHDDDIGCACALEQIQNALDQWFAAEQMHDFVAAGAHPCSLTSGQDDGHQASGARWLPHLRLGVHDSASLPGLAGTRLPGQDSNLDSHIQSVESYHWTTRHSARGSRLRVPDGSVGRNLSAARARRTVLGVNAEMPPPASLAC